MKKSILSAAIMVFVLASCGNTRREGRETINTLDTLQLIESEIMHADSRRLDSLRQDSIAKALQDSIAGEKNDSVK